MLTLEQQSIRAKGIGASEVGALVGLDPYRSPIDIWRRKVEGERSEDTIHTQRGRFLERAILEWYAADTGAEVYPWLTGSMPGHPLVLATPDGITTDRVVEAKAPSWRTAHEWDDGSVPERYVAQVTQQCLVAGTGKGDVVAYVDERLSIVTIHLDSELGASLVDAIETFWSRYVETRTPPPADGSESYAEWIKQRFAKTRGDIIEATPDTEAIARRLLEARRRVDEAEAIERETRSQLMAIIGDADGLRGQFGRVSWKFNKGSLRTDYEAICKELGVPDELIQKYTTTKPGPRVFRVSPAKEAL